MIGRLQVARAVLAPTLVLAGALTVNGCSRAGVGGEEPMAFSSAVPVATERVWVGPDYYANRLLDWRIRDGRIECVEGRPETALVEIAKDTHCDWIVVGVQGRTALADLLIGGTTDRVLKLADRPVLAVPATTVDAGNVTS